jgi:pyridoxamine 5'-phosphate oxidase
MPNESLANLRQDYRLASLLESEVPEHPIDLFKKWFEQAQKANVCEPNAMSISTVNADNIPSSRIVLLKDINANNELVFFTNYDSAKSTDLTQNSNAAILFAWIDLERQVRIQATAKKISMADSEAYFRSRPKSSQIGAWASAQSSVVSNREYLETSYKQLEDKFADTEVPMPAFWGGWVLKPSSFEFWQGRTSRLHDRLKYTFNCTTNSWEITRLSP